MKKLRKAVIPVAGLGTRFTPATKAMPKEMLPVVDKPLIQYAVEEARAAGIEQFCLITGRGKDAIIDHFDIAFELETTLRERHKKEAAEALRAISLPPGTLTTVRQQVPLGLGHAVLCAGAFIGDEPFAVLLPDDLILSEKPALQQLVEAYEATDGSNILAVTGVLPEQTQHYGILKPGKEQGSLIEIKGLVEKPLPAEAPSTLSVTGRYILQPQVIGYLEKQKKGQGGEIQLTDALAEMIKEQASFYGVRLEGERFDCGAKAGFLEAQIAFALKRPDLASDVRRFLRKYL